MLCIKAASARPMCLHLLPGTQITRVNMVECEGVGAEIAGCPVFCTRVVERMLRWCNFSVDVSQHHKVTHDPLAGRTRFSQRVMVRSRSMRAIFWKRLSPESSRGSGGRTRTTTLKLFPAATTPGAISSEGVEGTHRRLARGLAQMHARDQCPQAARRRRPSG